MLRLKTFTDGHTCIFCGITAQMGNTTCRSVVEIHHIIERKDGGKNYGANLVPCCSNHHSLIHTGDIVVDRYFNSTRGWLLRWTDKAGKEHYSPESK
jgi:5-methylcytosine-specific restriction endonuclease McrA